MGKKSSQDPRREGLFRWAFENAPVGVGLMSFEEQGPRLEAANPALARILGVSAEELRDRPIRELAIGESSSEERIQLNRVADGEVSEYYVERAINRPDGSVRWVAVNTTILDANDGSVNGVIHVEDITDWRNQNEALRRLVDNDSLTGLPNARRLEEELDRLIAEPGGTGALAVLGLDAFGAFNDEFGHGAGDEALRKVARRLESQIRASDLLVRIGGDRFALLLDVDSRAHVESTIERLLSVVRNVAPTSAGRPVERRLTASVGVATVQPGMATSGSAVLAAANRALRLAKVGGSDNAVILDVASDPAQAAQDLSLQQRVRDALSSGEGLALAAQPIIDLAKGEPVGRELLVRLRDGDGVVDAGEFITMAEESGLIRMLDRWVMHHAIASLGTAAGIAARGWGPDERIWINLSARSLVDPSLPEKIGAEIRRAGADPARIVFEITETSDVIDLDAVSLLVARIRGLGCSVALDDFGTGHDSFLHLRNIPCDIVKIDGVFIAGLADSEVDRAIVAGIAGCARALGKHVVAEFVNDDRTIELLREHGVEYGQGYFLGRPELID